MDSWFPREALQPGQVLGLRLQPGVGAGEEEVAATRAQGAMLGRVGDVEAEERADPCRSGAACKQPTAAQ